MTHTASNYLAYDLGAESGRAVLGRLRDGRLDLETVHRFANGPVRVLGGLYWDVLRLYDAMVQGLGLASRQTGESLAGIGLDTWGVDMALLGRGGALLGNPRHYRDPRTEGMMAAAFERVPREEIFFQTGIQFMEINTLYQLLAAKRSGDPALEQAERLLMMPDLLNYWLTGEQVSEFTIATTSQLYDPRRRDWARELMARLELPAHIMPTVVAPGTVVGTLHPLLAEETGAGEVPVIAPGCHDTASAVAAVPAQPDTPFAYISSGTWSLMGVEVTEPVISDDSLRFNFTNEGGVCGTYRLLKNIMGLWLVQECRRTWAQEGEERSYTELTELAAEAPAFGPLVEPDCHEFLRPGDMPARLRAFCRRTGQRVPEGVGELVRCALESLACKYRWVLERLELMLERRLEAIYVVGGGSRNGLLCQLTADATGRPVLAGPVEATAMGNLLMQALARGEIGSLVELREVVRGSTEMQTYEPRSVPQWDEAYALYLRLREQVPEA